MLRVHDDHWSPSCPGAPLAAYRGVPFDLADHPFTAQRVFDGRVTHASREALRATTRPATRSRPRGGRRAARSGCRPPARPGALVDAGARRHDRAATSAPELAAASRCRCAVGSAARRGVGAGWTRDDARRARRALVRRRAPAPPATCAGPAAVLAFAAWLVGRRRPRLVRRRPCRAAEPDALAGRAGRAAADVRDRRRTSGRRCRPRLGRDLTTTSARREIAPAGRCPAASSLTRVRTWAKRWSSRSSRRADRTRHREKVRRNLDVFARMLREARFDTDDPMTGLEIELNLVDDKGDPALKNAEVLEAIADAGLPDRAGPVQHRDQRSPRPSCARAG